MSGEDAVREERIMMEVVVDAYDSGERAMGWYYYLDDKLSFPYNAKCISVDKRTPLDLGELVTVEHLSGECCCKYEIYVDIAWKNKTLAIPLSQLKPIDADDDSIEAIGDWHYWISQGYRF